MPRPDQSDSAAVIDVLPVAPSLAELGEVINREHEAALAAAYSSLMHAIRAGEALHAAREQVPRGEWETWIADNCPQVTRMARNYIRLAVYRNRIPEEIEEASKALMYLRGLPATDGTGPAVHPPAVREEALRLVADGVSLREAGRMLGIGRNCVARWVREQTGGPAHGHTKRDRGVRAALLRRKLAEQALREKARDRAIRQAVRKAGAATAEAWAMAERMQNVLGQAHRESTDPEARRALSLAGEHYRKMRDEIVRALGVT